MASLQNSAGRYVGSSFTIKNILNLPEDESNGNEKISQFSRSTLVSSPTRLVHGLALNTSPDKYRPRGSWPDDRVFFGKQPSWNMATSIASHTFLLGKWSRNSRLCLRKVNCSSKFVFPRFYIGLCLLRCICHFGPTAFFYILFDVLIYIISKVRIPLATCTLER